MHTYDQWPFLLLLYTMCTVIRVCMYDVFCIYVYMFVFLEIYVIHTYVMHTYIHAYIHTYSYSYVILIFFVPILLPSLPSAATLFDSSTRKESVSNTPTISNKWSASNTNFRYGMVWYGMVWYGMVWYSMVWYGVVWYGMVWYGMVWYGIV